MDGWMEGNMGHGTRNKGHAFRVGRFLSVLAKERQVKTRFSSLVWFSTVQCGE